MYFIENAKIKLIIEQKFFLDRICLFQDIDLYFRIFLKKRGLKGLCQRAALVGKEKKSFLSS